MDDKTATALLKATKQVVAEVRELRAMIAQLRPVESRMPIQDEIAACDAQGIDVATYFKEKGRKKRQKSRVSWWYSG